jgi:hypothetical protein
MQPNDCHAAPSNIGKRFRKIAAEAHSINAGSRRHRWRSRRTGYGWTGPDSCTATKGHHSITTSGPASTVRDGEARRLGGLQIDDEIKPGRLLDRK